MPLALPESTTSWSSLGLTITTCTFGLCRILEEVRTSPWINHCVFFPDMKAPFIASATTRNQQLFLAAMLKTEMMITLELLNYGLQGTTDNWLLFFKSAYWIQVFSCLFHVLIQLYSQSLFLHFQLIYTGGFNLEVKIKNVVIKLRQFVCDIF